MNDYAASVLNLYDALIGGAPAQKLINIAREYLGNPIHVSNPSMGSLLHSEDTGIKDKTWERVTSSDYNKQFYLTRLASETDDLHKMLASREPMLLDKEIHDHRIIGHYIRWENKILGHIMLFEYYQDFKDTDFIYLRKLGDILAYLEIRSSNLGFLKNPEVEMTLAALLNKRHVSPEIIARSLFPLDFSRHYVLAVMESISEKNDHKLPLFFVNILSVRMKEARIANYEERIVLLFQRGKLEELDLAKHEVLFKEYHIRCGISNTFDNIKDIHAAYEEALGSLRNGAFFAPTRCIFRYFPLFHVFDILNQERDLTRFVHPAITKLLDYDATYHTKYFSNLAVFVFSGRDIARTANVFNVHKNTIHYRIKKIEEMIESDSFNDDIFIFQVRLSTLILYYIDPNGFYKKYDIPCALTLLSEWPENGKT